MQLLVPLRILFRAGPWESSQRSIVCLVTRYYAGQVAPCLQATLANGVFRRVPDESSGENAL